MDQRYVPTGNPMRWTGNVFAALAFVLLAGLALEWLTGWSTYCWIRFQIGALTYLYGATIGALALIFAAFKKFKLAAAIALPAVFPIFWSILERETGFVQVCAAAGS